MPSPWSWRAGLMAFVAPIVRVRSMGSSVAGTIMEATKLPLTT